MQSETTLEYVHGDRYEKVGYLTHALVAVSVGLLKIQCILAHWHMHIGIPSSRDYKVPPLRLE